MCILLCGSVKNHICTLTYLYYKNGWFVASVSLFDFKTDNKNFIFFSMVKQVLQTVSQMTLTETGRILKKRYIYHWQAPHF